MPEWLYWTIMCLGCGVIGAFVAELGYHLILLIMAITRKVAGK